MPAAVLANTPISLVIGSLVCLYLMFSVSFRGLTERLPIARKVVNYRNGPRHADCDFYRYCRSEYTPMPDIRFGITAPAFSEMWSYLPFTLGFPDAKIFMLAIPTAVIAYIIAFGDIIVGQSLMQRADELRPMKKSKTTLTACTSSLLYVTQFMLSLPLTQA